MGGPQCRMSILRNGNVPCICTLFSPMSHVEFKKRLCPMSLHFYPSCRMSLSPMSHVEFKKGPCRPVGFRGQGPFAREGVPINISGFLLGVRCLCPTEFPTHRENRKQSF